MSKYLIENKPQAPQTDETDSIQKALELLLAADAIVILVGMSMTSDIPSRLLFVNKLLVYIVRNHRCWNVSRF